MKLTPGTVLADRYEIIERLGSGGMAIVYRVLDKKLGRFVALKVMREEYVADAEFLARFGVEARAAAGLSNPNVVTIYDVGHEGSVNYIIMEYVDGITLKDLIIRRAPFDNDEILGVAIQIASALQLAHQNKIIHRDIKPQNILVTTAGIVKVTDFGIARAATTNTLTEGNTTLGSVHYSSPEQARGGYIDAKSDIYSLGIVMYEMATGTLPFNGETPVAVALKHINEPLPSIKERNTRVSDSLVKIIMKATEKSSAKRFQSAEEMSNELKRALTNDASGGAFKDNTEKSPTVKLTAEDIEAIKNDALKKEARSTFFGDDDVPDDEVLPSEEEADGGYGDSYEEPYGDGDEDSRDGYEDGDYGDSEDFEDDDGYDEDYEDEAADKKAERKIVIAGVLTGVAIIALVSSILFNFWLKNRPVPQQVPELVGKTMAQANAEAQLIGVTVNLLEERADDGVAAGLIISQSVLGPEPIYKGDTIDVIVSTGTDKVEVPDLIGKSDGDVEKTMQEYIGDKKLNWSMEYEFSGFPINISIRQVPEKGTMVEKNTNITVFFSQGPELKEKPVREVLGRTETEAINIMQADGFVVTRTEKVSHATVKAGLVISQNPAPGTLLKEGASVSFTVSTGKPPATPTPTAEPDGRPAASAAPTPTQASAPTPTPVPSIAPEAAAQKSFPVDLRPYLVEGQKQVHMMIYKMEGTGLPQVWYNKYVDVAMFPMTLTDVGITSADYQIYIIDEDETRRHVATQTLNFNE